LVETLATLGVLMVMGVAASKLLTAVTDVGVRTGRNNMARAMTVRLAADFRSDIAAAESVVISEDGADLKIKIADRQVRYHIDSPQHTVSRIVENAGADSAKQTATPLAFEEFTLAARCVPIFSQHDEIIRLELTPPNPSAPWTIEAVTP
jgi:hypothetical protein